MAPRTNLSSKIDSLKTKSIQIEASVTETPGPAANFQTLFESNSAARRDSSNEFTIDVFPNMIPILCYVLQVSLQYADQLEARKHSKVSISTIALYNMAIIYGYFMLSDMYVRPSPSIHAQLWHQSNFRKQFADFLLTLPFPDYLIPILNEFPSTSTEHQSNIFWIPSAAGFDYHHFFGRLVPMTFFSAIHDTTCEIPSNTPATQIMSHLFGVPLYVISKVSRNRGKFTASIADFISVLIESDTAASVYNSKFYQIFSSVFQPTLFRDYQRRSCLASLALNHPTYATPRVINAYDFMFSATSANLSELRIVLQSIAGLMKGVIPYTQDLASFMSSNKGIKIIAHGISEYPLPTWSHHGSDIPLSDDKKLKLKYIPSADFASRIRYLVRPDLTPTITQNGPIVIKDSDQSENPAGYSVKYNDWPWVLLHPKPGSETYPDPDDDFILFDEDQNVYPPVYVLNPVEPSTIDAWKVSLAGKTIETLELDGTTIAIPNVRISLGPQNAQFADSAIPFKKVYRATRFYETAAPRYWSHVLERQIPSRSSRLLASSLLINRTQVILPRPDPDTIDNLVANTLPGLTLKNNVVWLSKSLSFLGLSTVDARAHSPSDDNIPGSVVPDLHVWSPYTYTAFIDDDIDTRDYRQTRSYFLTNLRTIFGTGPSLVEIRHPYEAMPVL
jgi:hypothetical protein